MNAKSKYMAICAGAGKARMLEDVAKELGFPVYHLDAQRPMRKKAKKHETQKRAILRALQLAS